MRCIGRYIFERDGVIQTNILTKSGVHLVTKVDESVVKASMGEVRLTSGPFDFAVGEVLQVTE